MYLKGLRWIYNFHSPLSYFFLKRWNSYLVEVYIRIEVRAYLGYRMRFIICSHICDYILFLNCTCTSLIVHISREDRFEWKEFLNSIYPLEFFYLGIRATTSILYTPLLSLSHLTSWCWTHPLESQPCVQHQFHQLRHPHLPCLAITNVTMLPRQHRSQFSCYLLLHHFSIIAFSNSNGESNFNGTRYVWKFYGILRIRSWWHQVVKGEFDPNSTGILKRI